MANNREVFGQLEGDVAVLTVTYSPERMEDPDAPLELAREMTEEYNRLEGRARTKDCVVVIDSDIAGSPIVRALVELYILVSSKRGQLLLAGYPDDYFFSLTAAAITDQPGFRAFRTKQDALGEASNR